MLSPRPVARAGPDVADDQAALHLLYLGLGGVAPRSGGGGASPAAWVPDAAANGGGDGGGGGCGCRSTVRASFCSTSTRGRAAPRKLAANYSMCHDGAHEPLQRVRPQARHLYRLPQPAAPPL